jgi:hypothetical protein
VLILTFGPLSGAHFNPAVSLAFAWRGELPARLAGLYIAAQVVAPFATRTVGPMEATVNVQGFKELKRVLSNVARHDKLEQLRVWPCHTRRVVSISRLNHLHRLPNCGCVLRDNSRPSNPKIRTWDAGDHGFARG